MIAEAAAMERACRFSEDRVYRYTLWREWPVEEMLFGGCSAETRAHQYLMVIGLNPSTADETKNDPTIRRCIDFAQQWGFGALCMTNLFAYRQTDPKKMKLAADPIGPDNDEWLRICAKDAGLVLAAWGKDGKHLNRAAQVLKLLSGVHCLKTNGDGSPAHPLYIPADTIPIPLPV